MKFHRTLLLVILVMVLFVAPTFADNGEDYLSGNNVAIGENTGIQGNKNHHNIINSGEMYIGGDEGDVYAEGGTGVGVGIAIVPVDIEVENEIDVDTDVDVDVEDYNFVVQEQRQTSKQANKQKTTITIEDKIQHPNMGLAGHGPDMLAPPTPNSFHNNVWLDFDGISIATAKAFDIAPGYMWGVKVTVKKQGEFKPTTYIKELGGSDPADPDMIGVITVRGNVKTKGYEIEATALRLAMEMGGKYFVVIGKPGYETVGRSLNIGPSGSTQLSDVSNHDGKMAVGGSGAGFFNWGSAQVKAKMYYSIAVGR